MSPQDGPLVYQGSDPGVQLMKAVSICKMESILPGSTGGHLLSHSSTSDACSVAQGNQYRKYNNQEGYERAGGPSEMGGLI